MNRTPVLYPWGSADLAQFELKWATITSPGELSLDDVAHLLEIAERETFTRDDLEDAEEQANTTGFEAGQEEGLKEGYQNGHADGLTEGYQDCEEDRRTDDENDADLNA